MTTGMTVTEAFVKIKDQPLSFSESMTLRVAIEDMKFSMSQPYPLGSDEAGRAIQQGYLDNLRTISLKLYGPGPVVVHE